MDDIKVYLIECSVSLDRPGECLSVPLHVGGVVLLPLTNVVETLLLQRKPAQKTQMCQTLQWYLGNINDES